jgi:hypothetical protein
LRERRERIVLVYNRTKWEYSGTETCLRQLKKWLSKKADLEMVENRGKTLFGVLGKVSRAKGKIVFYSGMWSFNLLGLFLLPLAFVKGKRPLYVIQAVQACSEIPVTSPLLRASMEKMVCMNNDTLKKARGVGLKASKANPIIAGPETVFGYYGKKQAHRGLEELKEAFKEAKPENARLCIVTEFRKNVLDEVRKFDVVVFPFKSLTSVVGVPVSVIESMFLGKAVIVSKKAAVKGITLNWKNCVVYETREELVQAIRGLAKNPEKRLKLGLEAFRTARKHFDAEKNAKRILSELK